MHTNTLKKQLSLIVGQTKFGPLIGETHIEGGTEKHPKQQTTLLEYM